jgi:hypothetical protein
MSRRAVVVISVAAVAAGGILGSALAMQGPAKLSLSANSDHRHQMHSSGMMGGQSSGMHSNQNMPMTMRRHHMRSTGMMAGQAFTTLDNQGDPTFNQLLGINNRGQIAGYFGSGAAGHPNKGYLLTLQHGMSAFQNENFPGSVQTQVTGLNDHGVTVGFWSNQNTASMMNNNFGFYAMGGRFHTVNFPARMMGTQVNQLLGVNDFGVAVGFYTNGAGANRGYEYNIFTHRFSRVLVPGAPRHGKGPSLTAAAINNRGDVAGFYDTPGGMTDAFLKTAMGTFIKLAYPGASMTQAFGVNDHEEVVGAYTTGSGNNAMTFGFTWTPRGGFKAVNAPQGQGATTINGVNNAGALVGFYTDMGGNTHGLLVSAMRHRMPMQMNSPMPTTSPSMMMTSPPPTMGNMGTPPATSSPMPMPTGTSYGNHS